MVVINLNGKENSEIIIKTGRGRIPAIDIFRGLAIVIMLVSDSLPDFVKAYPWILHSEWQGMTVADAAFPGFMFIMGASAIYSHDGRAWQPLSIARRVVLLIILGLLYNFIPAVIAYMALPDFNGKVLYDSLVVNGRYYGVLQRLGLCYGLGLMVFWLISRLKKDKALCLAMGALAFLVISTAGYHLFNLAEPNGALAPYAMGDNISNALDGAIFGNTHNYEGKPFDPEGLYGTLNSTATFLLGMVAGIKLKCRDGSMGKWGLAIMALGLGWSFLEIIGKPLWTAPFVLLNAGGGMLVLWGINCLGSKGREMLLPFTALGRNAIFMYIFNGLLLTLLWIIPSAYLPLGIINTLGPASGQLPLYQYIWMHTLYWPGHQELSGLLFALLWSILLTGVACILYRKNLFIRL